MSEISTACSCPSCTASDAAVAATSAVRWDLRPRRARIVTTRYAGATATRGSRIVAVDGITGYRCAVAYSHGVDVQDNHRRAMVACLMQQDVDLIPYTAGLIAVGDDPDGGMTWSLVPGHEMAD